MPLTGGRMASSSRVRRRDAPELIDALKLICRAFRSLAVVTSQRTRVFSRSSRGRGVTDVPTHGTVGPPQAEGKDSHMEINQTETYQRHAAARISCIRTLVVIPDPTTS